MTSRPVPADGARPPLELSRRSLLKGAAAIGGATLLAACGQAGGQSTTAAGQITVTDQRGKTIVFDGPVKRVVTLPMPAAAMLISVDKTSKHLVGMHDASWVAMQEGIMGTMFPAALKIPHDVADESFSPNVESILALNPDIVVQWADQGAGIIAPMENAGLKVVGMTYGSQRDLDVWINLFATMLGKPARGHDMVSKIGSQLKSARSAGASRPTPGPSILYFFQLSGGLQVAGGNTYNDYYINLVGAHNPASGDQGAQGTGTLGVDIEQVLAWDPDIVLIGNFDEALPDQIYSDKVWQSVSAVKSRRVYKVPLGGYRWDPPGQESPLMWQWLSKIAFPGAQSGLRNQIVSYYDYLYGYRPTNAQMDQILWTKANSHSANYQQFDAA
ncbi:MAG: ABC transporter substrate-binding protein [Nocardioidaceae bacterium]